MTFRSVLLDDVGSVGLTWTGKRKLDMKRIWSRSESNRCSTGPYLECLWL